MAKASFGEARLSRLSSHMGADVPSGERCTFTSPLAKAVLTRCLDGPLWEGSLTLKPGFGFKAGDCSALGLWCGHVISSADYITAPILCGYMGDQELSAEEYADLMRLEIIDHTVGRYFLNDPDDKEDYNARRPDGKFPSQQAGAFENGARIS